MATWSGWQNQFLLAAGVVDTPPNRDFLTEWAKHASSPQCKNNPIDLHHKVGSSTNCDHPAGFAYWTQAYTSHAHAATAFGDQLRQQVYLAISDTLGTGNPWQDPGYKLVHKALLAWPSNNFAAWYLNKMTGAGGPGGGGGGKAARAHSGWNDLRHSVNHNMPKALRTSERHTHAALRALSKARKVRL